MTGKIKIELDRYQLETAIDTLTVAKHSLEKELHETNRNLYDVVNLIEHSLNDVSNTLDILNEYLQE